MTQDVYEYSQKLAKAERLKQEISDIDYYIHIIDVYEPFPVQTKSWFTKTIETVKETTYTLIGTRYYGLGTLKKEIKVPASLLMDLAVLAKKKRQELIDELNEILK